MNPAKQQFLDYLTRENLFPTGCLKKDILEMDVNSNPIIFDFHPFKFLLDNLIRVQRSQVREFFEKLCNFRDDDPQQEAQYENQLTELLAIQFVGAKLNHKITRIESKSSHVTSPNAAMDKNGAQQPGCDFAAIPIPSSHEHYYEVKHMSKQDLAMFRSPNGFTPSLEREIAEWIQKRVLECCTRKGANYLICHVPVWTSRSIPNMDESWLRQLFPNCQKIAPIEFACKSSFNVPEFFHGVYLIKSTGYLLLRF